MAHLILAIYFIETFDRFGFLVSLLLSVMALTTCVMGLYLTINTSDYYAKGREQVKCLFKSKWFKYLWVIAILGLLVPSKQTMHIMLGLHVGNEVVTEVTKSSLYEKAYKLLEKAIEEQLQEETKK